MRLSELASALRRCGVTCEVAGGDTEVRAIVSDSREVKPGALFVALPGTKTDGLRYVEDAVRAGAAAVAYTGAHKIEANVPALLVDDAPAAAGLLAAAFLSFPAGRLDLVGVTGTNGKTSCTYLLESIWAAAGERPGVVGTVSVRWPGHERSATITTPAAVDLQYLLQEMARAGATCAAIEVSSHALAQKRVAGCTFAAAIFTNLTRDHLDYHGDEERYFSAKSSLFFDYLRADGIAVINLDDPYGARLARALAGRAKVLGFSSAGAAGAYARPLDVTVGLDGLRGRIRVGNDEIVLACPLLGRVNLENCLAAVAVAHGLGVGIDRIEEGLRACRPVPGRLERVDCARPSVLVDYAHTPDALARVLDAVRDLCQGRTIVVFGCGGDRDRGKRPLMARAAAERAHVCILTSDNPRSEDPLAILREIESGLSERMVKRSAAELAAVDAGGYTVEPDRARAIALALELACADDVVVVAGKGHETYQEVAGVRRPFDDRAVVRELRAQGRAAAR